MPGQRLDDLLVGELPYQNTLIRAAAGDQRQGGVPGDAGVPGGESPQHIERGAVYGIPEPDRAVFAGAGQDGAVRAPCDLADHIGMAKIRPAPPDRAVWPWN